MGFDRICTYRLQVGRIYCFCYKLKLFFLPRDLVNKSVIRGKILIQNMKCNPSTLLDTRKKKKNERATEQDNSSVKTEDQPNKKG